jgi:S1-C subfamily serine protease
MTASQTLLSQLSAALATQSAAASASLAAITLHSGRHLTAIVQQVPLQQSSILVTSEQSLPEREEFDVVAQDGATHKAKVAGRDPGTNIAVLRLENELSIDPFETARARPGALALAYGADGKGGVRCRLGVFNSVGPEWHSQAGGRIDERVIVDIQLSRVEEGGPVLDAAGAFVGMSTFGPRGQVLVIPAATIERVVPILLRDGRIARGWLGLAMQPVAVPDALLEAAGQRSGMMVMSTVEGGPAANAGIVAGDILLTIDAAPARRIHQLAARLDADRIGKEIELRVIHSGAVTTLRAVIAARPTTA